MQVSKTDYLLWRECAKNAWYKMHQPELFFATELSDFEKALIETGNEVEEAFRQRFLGGVLVEGRDEAAVRATQELGIKQAPVIFQAAFSKDGFFAAADVLEFVPQTGSWRLYEVKSTTEVDKKTHYHDLAFQAELLGSCGLRLDAIFLAHLNPEYVRRGELDLMQLFSVQDLTQEVQELQSAVRQEMEQAKRYLAQTEEPAGRCSCIYKGRSSHCATFVHANPGVPAYGVHDLVRIGASKGKLQDMVDVGMLELQDISEEIKNTLSQSQQNQIEVALQGQPIIDRAAIAAELDQLDFPLYFLDYETFPSAIPRFDGFSPYRQIPFQYSLYVADAADGVLSHFEFIYTGQEDPSRAFAESLRSHIGGQGSVIVWNKRFECGINSELAQRNLEFKMFMDQLNARVYDLMDIFAKQYYVHKDFKGRVSIKKVLPVLAPGLSYQELAIREGGTASQSWGLAVSGRLPANEQQKIFSDLKEYCKLDTYAMYAIFNHLLEVVAG